MADDWFAQVFITRLPKKQVSECRKEYYANLGCPTHGAFFQFDPTINSGLLTGVEGRAQDDELALNHPIRGFVYPQMEPLDYGPSSQTSLADNFCKSQNKVKGIFNGQLANSIKLILGSH